MLEARRRERMRALAEIATLPTLACLAAFFAASIFFALLVSDDTLMPIPTLTTSTTSTSTTSTSTSTTSTSTTTTTSTTASTTSTTASTTSTTASTTSTTASTTIAPNCSATNRTWANETIGSGAGAGASMALDSVGEPFVFFGPPALTVWITRRSGGSWTEEIVEARTQIDTSTRSLSAGLVDGQPACAYRLSTTSLLHFAQYNGSAWVVQDFEAGGASASLAVAPDGHPHIAHYNSANLRLYSRSAGPTWSGQQIATSGAYFASCALVFLGANPAVAYQDVTNFSPVVDYGAYVYNGSTWNNRVAETGAGSFAVLFVAAAVDSSGNLLFAYEKRPSGSEMKYAELVGTLWSFPELVPGAVGSAAGLWPSLASICDKPMLAFCNSSGSGDICAVVVRESTGWAFDVSYGAADGPDGTTIVDAGYGYPAIAFKIGSAASPSLAYAESSAA